MDCASRLEDLGFAVAGGVEVVEVVAGGAVVRGLGAIVKWLMDCAFKSVAIGMGGGFSAVLEELGELGVVEARCEASVRIFVMPAHRVPESGVRTSASPRSVRS